MKNFFETRINHISEVAKKYEFNTLVSELQKLNDESEAFKLKVILVGSFSAGKSALINAMLHRELLEEGQRPETSIASELVYSENEYIEAIKNGKCEAKYAVDEADGIDTKEYDYLIWNINNDVLKKYNDCIIVDFPGFNSGIEDHNKAIIQYAGKGNAYLLVVDSEDGTIKQNVIEFIEEIQNYDDNVAIVVSKADLKTKEDIEKVISNVKRNAELIFDSEIVVEATSKFDEDVSDKVQKIIENFDRDDIFKKMFFAKGCDLAYKCKDSIEVYKNSLELDLTDFDKEIEKHEISKKRLSEQLEKDKIALGKKLKSEVAPKIIGDLQSALYGNVDTLTNALAGGEKAFSLTVNNILRPVLMTSTNNYVKESFESYINSITIDDSNIDESVKEISEEAIQKYQRASEKIQEIADGGEKLGKTYKAVVTALAVVTDVIAPWLELVLIFVPDILKMFGAGNQENTLRNKVNNEIIPQLLASLEPEIQNSLFEMKSEMIEALEEQFNENLNKEIEAIESAKQMREKNNNEYEKEMQIINEDINTIDNVIEQFLQEGEK